MIKKLFCFTFLFVFCSSFALAKVKSIEEQRAEWNEWVEDLKEEMIDKGISKSTIKKAYKSDYFHEIKEVVLQDKKQAEFVLTSDVYLNKLVNKDRVKKAREHYKELLPKYTPHQAATLLICTSSSPVQS